jgi:hypothetical protein
VAIINYTAEQINALLAKAATAAQPADVSKAVDTLQETAIGDLGTLETSAKDSVVDAINENFTSASEGKKTIAAALTGQGQSAAATDTFAVLAGKIGALKPAEYVDPSQYCRRLVTNEDSIIPTGSYATSTYYDTTYGVKIGYMANGDILLSMKGGTTTAYEYLQFTAASVPSGVTVDTTVPSSNSYVTMMAGMQQVCVIHGITKPVKIAIDMSSYNATYDYTNCALTITEV